MMTNDLRRGMEMAAEICEMHDCGDILAEAIRAAAAEQRAEAMGKEDTVESLGDWQYLSADDGWITCPDRAAAEREQKTLNTVIRYVRYYHLAAIASGAGESK